MLLFDVNNFFIKIFKIIVEYVYNVEISFNFVLNH